MSLGKRFLFVGVGSLALFARPGMADQAAPAGKQNAPTAEKAAKPAVAGLSPAAAGQSPSAASEAIGQLIEQLDSADYDAREAACGKLAAKGKAAIAALEKAASNGNLEVSSRATIVLGKLLESSDEPTAKAAKDALQHLTDGDSPAAARKAKSILDKKNGVNNNGQGIIMPGNGFGGQIIINGGQLIIGGGMRTMSVKNTNGVKEIDASEDGKTVKIKDDPAQGIKIEYTEKQNGKDVTKKYDAKNAAELKKNQPAGYELYKKYSGDQPGNGNMPFRLQKAGQGILQLQGNAFPGNVIPAIPLRPAAPLPLGQPWIPGPAAPATAVPQGNPPIESATRMVKNLSSRLQRLQKAGACKSASPESKAELKKQIDELSRQLDDLRRQLGEK